MHLVERAKSVMLHAGAEWVMWLMLALSVVSVAASIERALALRALRCDRELIRQALRDSLRQGGFARARVAVARFAHLGAAARVCAWAQRYTPARDEQRAPRVSATAAITVRFTR